MLIRLDPRSDKPIYRQIADCIVNSIDDGTLEAGTRLPSARDLSQTLDVNMHTVLRAYSELESWGRVNMRRGRGGVVVADGVPIATVVTRMVSEARRRGMSKADLMAAVEEAWR